MSESLLNLYKRHIPGQLPRYFKSPNFKWASQWPALREALPLAGNAAISWGAWWAQSWGTEASLQSWLCRLPRPRFMLLFFPIYLFNCFFRHLWFAGNNGLRGSLCSWRVHSLVGDILIIRINSIPRRIRQEGLLLWSVKASLQSPVAVPLLQVRGLESQGMYQPEFASSLPWTGHGILCAVLFLESILWTARTLTWSLGRCLRS